MRIIVTCMKNEAPFMLEWFAYHLSIGFDKVLLYTNDCDDKTDAIADRLAELGLCEHLENPKIGQQRPQAVAMHDMFKREIVKDAEWVFFADCDEFLNIHLGDGRHDDLLQAMGDAVVISAMWRLFGDAGIAEYCDLPVIEQFLRAAPKTRPVSVNSWGFKSLFRPGPNVERTGAHRPFFKDLNAVAGKWLTSAGQQMIPPSGMPTHVGDSQAVRSLTQCGEPMRFAMAAPIDLRNDFDSVSLRRLDATQTRAVCWLGRGLRWWQQDGCVADRRRRSADQLCASTPADRTGLWEVTGRTLEAPITAAHSEVVEAPGGRRRRALAAQGPGAVALGDVRHARATRARCRLRQDLGAAAPRAKRRL